MTKFKTAIMKYGAVPAATGLISVSMAFPALASEAAPAADVSSAVSMATSAMGLFTSYPLNIFVAGGLVLMGFRLFRGGRKAAG